MEHNLNQQERGRSILTPPLHFQRVRLKDVSRFVKEHHYSKTHPGGVDFAFALYYNGELAGAALFGHMAGNPKALCVFAGHDNPKEYRELMRLVLLDHVPKNSETRFVAWCLRELKRTTDLKAIISFADPKYGHSGTIYKAGNWIYTGLQKQDRSRLIIDGTEVHPRQAYNRYGTSSATRIQDLGHTVELQPREPKHRYIFPLRPELAHLLKYTPIDWKLELAA